MLRLLSLVSLLLLTLSQSPVRASPCLSFDVTWNLLAFGFKDKDWNAGPQSGWTTTTTATDITTTGRPPFDGANTTCYLAQFFNAIYVLNGDAKNPNSIYIYDASAKSWSTQTTTPGSFDYSSFEAILDHDTNEFYAVSRGNIFSLDMGTIKAATSQPIPWNLVQTLDLGSNYSPVMALAQNHIHFLNLQDSSPGSASIYVIHFAHMQPQTQSYPLNNGSGQFPNTHGQTASFFMDSGVQQEFAFMPDDYSGSYVVNVESNSTQLLAAPPVKDSKSTYVASTSSLLQLDSAGGVHFLAYAPADPSANSQSSWKSVNALLSVATPQSGGSSTSSSQKVTNTGTPGGTNTSTSASGGALSNYAVTSGLVGLAVLFAILGFF